MNSLHKQSISHDICSGIAPDNDLYHILYVKNTKNTVVFFVIAIKCFLATIDKSSTTTTIHSEYMIVSGSL